MGMRPLAILAAIAMPLAALNSYAGGAEGIKIALAGDSTVEDCKLDGLRRGWGQEIGPFFKDDVKISNFAMSGRSSKSFISDGRWARLLASKPDFILLQFGHNDSHGKGKPESTDAATDYREYLRKYASDAKAAGVEIVFITPMHRGYFDKAGEPVNELLPYAEAMKETAKERGIPCVDLNSSSGALLKSLGEKGSDELFFSPKNDRTHFSEKGAKAMAELVAQGLKSSGAKVAAHLK